MRHASTRSSRQAESGFSVIELLVALVILGFVMAMLPRTLSLASRALRAADVIDAKSSEAIAIDFLASHLEQAMPVYRRLDDGLLSIAFSGREHMISFVAPLSAGKDATGLADFTLKRDVSGEGSVTLIWQIFRADKNPDQPKPPVHTRVFLPTGEGFSLRYRGQKQRDETGAFGTIEAGTSSGPQLGDWQTEWTARELLPNEVEITYKSTSGQLHARTVQLKLVPQR